MRVTRLIFLPSLFFLSGACSGIFYQPDRYIHYPPEKFSLRFEQVAFKSRDQTQLYGWFFPAKNSKGLVVQFHGNAENMSSHYLSLVWLVHEGYDVWTFDYRGYGKSEGAPSQEGVYADALAALDEGWSLHQKSSPRGLFVVYGQSLGGAVAMRAVDDFAHKGEISLMVMDSTFVSYIDAARWFMAERWLFWPFEPLAYLLISNGYSPERAIKNNKIPLLVIHDERDPVVAFANGRDLYDLAPGKPGLLAEGAAKEMWVPTDGYHVGVFANPRAPWRGRFRKLLDGIKR